MAHNDILQTPDNDRYDLFVAYNAGVPVAAGQLRRDMTANRHLALLSVDVHPRHRQDRTGRPVQPKLLDNFAAARSVR